MKGHLKYFPVILLLTFSMLNSQTIFKSTGVYNRPDESYTFSTDEKNPVIYNFQHNVLQPNYFVPNIYMYLYGGMGFSILSSSKIKKLFGDEFGIGIGLPTWSWGLIVGYKNIAQFEYNNGIADHDFNNNSIIPDVPSEVIEMDYRTTDLQIKINPFFWNMDENSAYFIVIGKGDVTWEDKDKDGFEGTCSIFGLEYAQVSEYTTWGVSFKRYGIDFDKTILFNIPFDFKTDATDYILEFKIGIGFNI